MVVCAWEEGHTCGYRCLGRLLEGSTWDLVSPCVTVSLVITLKTTFRFLYSGHMESQSLSRCCGEVAGAWVMSEALKPVM